MEGKAKYIFPWIMTAQMVLMVTLVATYVNIGPRPDFFWKWMGAYFLCWPIAAISSMFAMPVARRATGFLIGLIDRKA